MNPDKSPEHTRALLILVAGAFTISFSPVIVKLLGRDVLGATAIGFWRTIIGGLVLMLIAVLQRQRLRMAVAPASWCIFTGLFFALDLAVWHRSILYIGAGMATLLGNTHVFLTSAAGFLVFKETLTRRFLLAVPMAFFGLILLIGVMSESVQFTGPYIRGVILGFLSAGCYAFYMVGLKKATDHPSHPGPAPIMTWICLSAALFTGVGSFFEEESFMPPDLRAFGLLLLLGVVGQAIAWWGIAHAMKRVAIHHTALILLLQPALSILWGLLFFGETLVFSQIIGAVITLSAIYVGSGNAGKRKAIIED